MTIQEKIVKSDELESVIGRAAFRVDLMTSLHGGLSGDLEIDASDQFPRVLRAGQRKLPAEEKKRF